MLARGRDPYFPPWPDVVQLDAFSQRMRDATVETLVAIGDQCDGVRCDMAMLLLNDVFAKTWGDRVGPRRRPSSGPRCSGRVRERHPEMLFVAEAYWDLEWALQQQGFDHCYDKRLYDRLVGEDAAVGTRAPARRRRLPAAAGPVPGEPRRAAGRDDVGSGRPGAGRRGSDRDPARRDALARGPVRRPAGPAAGVPRPPAGRAARRRAASRSTVTWSPRSRPPGCGRGGGRRWTAPAGRTTRRTSRSSPGAGGTATGGTWSS